MAEGTADLLALVFGDFIIDHIDVPGFDCETEFRFPDQGKSVGGDVHRQVCMESAAGGVIGTALHQNGVLSGQQLDIVETPFEPGLGFQLLDGHCVDLGYFQVRDWASKITYRILGQKRSGISPQVAVSLCSCDLIPGARGPGQT